MTSVAKARHAEAAPQGPATASHDKILIVDFGAQVTQLIARRVREAGVYCEIVPFNKAEEAAAWMKPRAIILSGGPAAVLDTDAPLPPKALYDRGLPMLGICYGEQAMAHSSAARSRASTIANSAARCGGDQASALFDGVWRSGERYRCG